MKSLNLAVIVSSAVLLLSGVAQAGDAYEKNQNNLNFISKRPHQPLPDSQEIEYPMAIVILFGLGAATLVNLFILPLLFSGKR